jgi:hypothetical protein
MYNKQLLTLSTDKLRKLVILVIIVGCQKVWGLMAWSESSEAQLNDQRPYKRHYNFKPFTMGNYTRQINCTHQSYYLLGPLFMMLHIHQPCLKALGTNIPFLSNVSTLGLKPSGGYSRQNGVSALRASKTGQVHLVCEVQILSHSNTQWVQDCLYE